MSTAQLTLRYDRSSLAALMADRGGWFLCLALGCVVAGGLIARGGLAPGGVLVGVAVVLLVLVLISSTITALAALAAWPVLAVMAYPLAGALNWDLVTFDRLWIGSLAAWLLITESRGESTRASRIVAIAVAWLAISYGVRAALTSGSTLEALQNWTDAIVLPVVLFFVARRLVRRQVDYKRICGAMAIAGTILGTVGLGQLVFGFELASVTGGEVRYDAAVDSVRISGPYPVPEVYALVLILCLAGTLCLAQITRSANVRLFCITAASIETLAIGMTLFRAAWLAVLAVFLLSIGLRAGSGRRLLASSIVVGITTMLVGIGLSQSETFTTRLENQENALGRVATYQQGLNVFATAPLFGVGVLQFGEAVTPLTSTSFRGVSALDQPHSSYAGLLAEQGIVGFLPLAALSFAVWWLVRTLRRHRSATLQDQIMVASVAGAAVGYVIMSATLTMLPYGPSNAFMALLIGVAAGRLDALQERRSDDPIPVTSTARTEEPTSGSPRWQGSMSL